MAQLTQVDLNTTKELILAQDLKAKKFELYAQNCQDTQARSMFNQEANQANNNVRTLMGYLNA